jgi:membrane-bound metal-dependent hydrolase YbcI (DUF457 family)
MDAGTHALASLAVARAFVPRAPRMAWLVVLIAGTVADLDALSATFGPSAYLRWHHTYTHSLVATIAMGALLTVSYLLLSPKSAGSGISWFALFASVLIAEWLHVAMDSWQSDGVALLWPFSGRRFSADWVASVDPWIIAVLIGAILLPELLRMVSDEIGAKDKGPHGRIGAILGLILILIYAGVRATLHSNAIATMQARSYRGETPRRVAAFPEPTSLMTWHGIVETDRALSEITTGAIPGVMFDPEGGVTLFKPESSPVLDRARNTDAVKEFLSVARFPKATVEKQESGYTIELRDLRYAATGQNSREIVAVVKLDANGRLLDDELTWARDLHTR